ncbi:MAG: hypothetical protein LBT76_03300 [Tannerella sp.]|jgi:hypothetical protein|nr:hypothetical protein [Tannerella sp.]
MEQRDYLLKQAEQLGQVLGKILADLLGLKNQGQTSLLETAGQTFNEELGLDIHELIALETDGLIGKLLSEKKFNNGHLEQLADLFFIMAEDMSREEKNRLNKKALSIYEYIESSELTYSFMRHWKMEKIKNDLCTA